MIKSMRLIRRDPLAFLYQTWQRHGDIAQFPIPRPGVYLVSEPGAVRSVLAVNSRDYSKRTLQYDNLALVTGEGLLTADDPPWRERRRVLQPAFHRDALEGACLQTGSCVEALLTRWSATGGAVVDIDQEMMDLSLNIVAAVLFGAAWERQAAKLTASTVVALDLVVARARNPLPPPVGWPTPGNRKMRRAVADLDAAVEQVLTARRSAGPAASADMIDLLLAESDGPDPVLDSRAIRDELVTFLIAGHETVASAMTWAWYLLGRSPDARRRLQAEADDVLGGRTPEFADLPNLPWARAVVDETLRLYPPAWVITRKALADHELAGSLVPKGSLVIMSPWLVHRHPDSYAQPEEFDPQRFLDRSSKAAPDYFPFGLGPRLCIGRDLALMECTLMLAAIAGRFDLTLASPAADTKPLASVTLRPRNPLRLTLRQRP